MVFTSFSLVSVASARESVFLEMGGSATGTFVFSSMAALSEAVNSNSDYIHINVQTTAGTSVHYHMLNEGLVDIASGSAFIDIEAWRGGSVLYPDPIQIHRTILMFARNYQTVLVPVGSGIYTMSDLNGRRISVGPSGIPSTGIAMATLEALGIEAELVFSTIGEQVELYQEGRVDAYFVTSAGGNANVVNAAHVVESRLLSLSEEEVERIMQGGLQGRSFPGVLTHETYAFIPPGEEITVMTDHSSVNVIADMDEQVVFDILYHFWNQHSYLRATLRGLNTTPEHIMMAAIYIHPGAARYYREVWGIDIPSERVKP